MLKNLIQLKNLLSTLIFSDSPSDHLCQIHPQKAKTNAAYEKSRILFQMNIRAFTD